MTRESFEERYPESRGPGVELGETGGVAYGDLHTAQVVIPPRRPAAERDADMARARERARCDRCSEVPEDLLLAIRRALRAAKEGRLPL